MSETLFDLEVPIGDHHYSIGRIPVFEQFSVAADFRDILVGLALLKRERPREMKEADYDKAVQYIIASRGGLSPEVRERVVNVCLKFTTRKDKQSGNWSPVLSADGTVMFNDINLPVLIKLLYKAFEHNKLIDFFFDGPSGSTEKKKATGQR